MIKRNMKILTDEELEKFKSYFEVIFGNDMIYIKTKNFNRLTPHKYGETFNLLLDKRKITISSYAIGLALNDFKDKHLVEIQNAINKLIVMYQKPNSEDVKKLLYE